MSFEMQEQYEAALEFLGMGDSPVETSAAHALGQVAQIGLQLLGAQVLAEKATAPQCNGLCQGHSSELSSAGWMPDANCPVHGVKATLLQNGKGD